MRTAPKVIVIGAGPGGLACAMQLAYHGCDVTVFEKQPYVGGRTSLLRLGDVRFDRGPTFLNMPHIVEKTFSLAGRSLHDYVRLVQLDPMYRLQFPDMHLDMTSDRAQMRATIEQHFPGNGEGYDRFFAQEERKFAKMAPLLQHKHDTLRDYIRLRFLRALPQMNVTQSLMERLGRYFTDERLQYAFTFQAKYLGMSPWECPAAFTILSYMEHAYGVHHPIGGMHQLPLAMERVLREHGGHVHTGVGVQRVITQGKRAIGVQLETGDRIQADYIVMNADFAYAANHLFEPGVLRTHTPKILLKKKFSCSAFMLYFVVKGDYTHLPHHTIVFSPDYRRNVTQITGTYTLPDEPSVYIHNPCTTDDTLAPAGYTALYVLAPVPNNRSHIDWDKTQPAFREVVLQTIARAGFADVSQNIVAETCITPDAWEHDMNIYAGATFSMGHQLSQMMYFRPHNRFGDVDRCWLVGGGTHPGSGLPTILESANITARGIMAQEQQSRGRDA